MLRKKHFHATYKLYIVFDLGVKTYIDKKSETIECLAPPNSAVPVKSCTVHRVEFEAETEGFERYVIYFTERFIDEMKDFLNGAVTWLTNQYVVFP